MSFNNLMESDCGERNPLVSIGDHFTQDQSFRQERAHPQPIELNRGDELVHEFLEENVGQNVQTFKMSELYKGLRDAEAAGERSSNSQAPNVAQLAPEETSSMWSEQFLNGQAPNIIRIPSEETSSTWPEQFVNDQASKVPPQANPGQAVIPAAVGAQIPKDKLKPVQGTLNDLSDTWSVDFNKAKNVKSQFGLGKDWVENFLRGGENKFSTESTSTYEKAEGGSSKFIKFMQTGKNQGEKDEVASEWSEEFAREKMEDSEMMEDAWEFDPDTPMRGNNEEYSDSFWKKLQEDWEKMSEDDLDSSSEDCSKTLDYFEKYNFEKENPMTLLENPFEEGLRRLEANDLASAVLCFEAAAQAQPENPLVWQYLGTTQAENEQDPLAIAALRKAIGLQKNNLIALMSLATSYTNENFENQACQVLKEWIVHNPKYSDLVKNKNANPYEDRSTPLSESTFKEVRNLYIKAANKFPFGEIDPDVQCGLGVLFNLSSEHNNAVDCFKAALQARPEDFRMWNRLGATLANGNRSEEAVDAYYNSLRLSPGYIRARYNIGITCINLGANTEAVGHLLTALNQQSKIHGVVGKVGTMSDSIWTTLKFVVTLLGKYDLIPVVKARDLATLNREFEVK